MKTAYARVIGIDVASDKIDINDSLGKIKLLPSRFASDPEAIARFQHEMRAVASDDLVLLTPAFAEQAVRAGCGGSPNVRSRSARIVRAYDKISRKLWEVL